MTDFKNHTEMAMASMVICFTILAVVVIAAETVKLSAKNSAMHMINAEWLEDPEKFRMVSRWGLKG